MRHRVAMPKKQTGNHQAIHNDSSKTEKRPLSEPKYAIMRDRPFTAGLPAHSACGLGDGDWLGDSTMWLNLLLFWLRQMRDHFGRHSAGKIGVKVCRPKYAVINRPFVRIFPVRCFSIKIKLTVAVVSPHSGLALNEDKPACLRPPPVRLRSKTRLAGCRTCKMYGIF